MHPFRSINALFILLTLPLSGCWLFEDGSPPGPVAPMTALPQTPPATPTAETAAAGPASPVEPTRDQRSGNIIPSFAQVQGAIHPRVSLAAPHEQKAAVSNAPSEDDRLTAIATEDHDFFQALEKDVNTWPDDERDRRAQAINDHYTDFLTDYPRNVNALILYGKFLRRVGERTMAQQVFLEARELDPTIAVVDQQLANYLAEEGQYLTAYDYLQRALAIAPDEPLYHYQTGELLNIYYGNFLKDKIFTQADLNEKIAGEFARAAELAPQEPRFAWRYAECFYDQRDPDWKRALAAWDALVTRASSSTELEIIRLHRARVLIELGRFDEARPLVEQPVHRSLEGSRAQLAKRVENPAPVSNGNNPAPPPAGS